MSAAAKTDSRLTLYYLSLGSNIEPEKNLPAAMARLRKHGEVQAVSSVWQTSPVGSTGPDFLNAAAAFRSPLSPASLRKKVLLKIEQELGRRRTRDKYAPRTIDMDILIAGDKVLDPEIWRQAHLAVPLGELYPELLHPGTGEPLTVVSRQLAKGAKLFPITLSL